VIETLIDRRVFFRAVGVGISSLAFAAAKRARADTANRPNIILCMADDLGWGDTGYNGHPVLKTPNLDAMAGSGMRFERFYAGAPVCSPTRGSCLTGRHPYRYGIFFANVGHMRPEEITLAEALKPMGYTTGHFGKWHLGTLTKKEKDSNRGGPSGVKYYSPPWENGFDVCFSTEAKVPTYDPMLTPAGWKGSGTQPGKPFGTAYWVGSEKKATDNLRGDDSRIIMDRVIPFIRNAVEAKRPFFSVIWFHAPHLPTVAGAKHRALYVDQPEKAQHYFGCITAMDEQVGRLRGELRDLGVAENTMLWFCSDNGPEGKEDTPTNGTAGPLRGRKRSLFEGGVRVPGLLEWPGRITVPRKVDIPCSTSDFVPTILDILGAESGGALEPVDGISLLPLIEDRMPSRPRPIGFESHQQRSLTDNRYKLISQDNGETYLLFDLLEDPGETKDLALEKPEVVEAMKATLDAWRASCESSREGKDYG